MTFKSLRNTLRCRWCPWITLRCRGTQTYDRYGMSYGERRLREHVLAAHYEDYLAAQGLVQGNGTLMDLVASDLTNDDEDLW